MSVIASLRQLTKQDIPVSQKLHAILEHLKSSRKPFTLDELSIRCNMDFSSDTALVDVLTQNPKIAFDGEKYRFQPTYPCTDRTTLLDVLQGHPFGVVLSELKESYEEVDKDLNELEKLDLCYRIVSKGNRPTILFPTFGKLGLSVSELSKNLWREVVLPHTEHDLTKELLEMGQTPVELIQLDQLTGIRTTSESSRPKKRVRNVIRQNVHLT
ncbi:hypothetical protein RCL1_003229 [Eukaryota sp. TZLM3-RCL]